jgi:hypothetical protein
MSGTIELAAFMRQVMENRMADVRVAMPGRVESYDVTTQTANIQPLIKEITETEGEDITETLPQIPSVPVLFPRSNGFFVTFPIAAGDTGLLVVCDRNIDQWISTGLLKDPQDKRKHHISGAVFYPGLYHSKNPLLDAHATDMVIGKDSGIQFHIKASGAVELSLAGKSLVKVANADDLQTWLMAHTHPTGTGPSGTPAQSWDTKINLDRLKAAEN